MTKKGIFSLIALLYLVFVFQPSKSYAENNSENLITGLSYELIYPENQTNKSLSYFDITMDKGGNQKLSLKLYNSLTKDMSVQVRFNTAKTNDIGNIEYGPSDLKSDASLAIDFSSSVKGPEQVVVPANGSKQVELTVSLPDMPFNGLIAGGIQLQPVEKNEPDSEKKKDIVVNEFAYLVGVVVRVGESDSIKPKLALNKTYIGFKEGLSQLLINISNTQPVYVEGMTLNVSVRKKNKQEDLFDYQQKALRMAPNSIMDFSIMVSDKGLTAGEYTAQITVSDKRGDHWAWTEDFKVSDSEANDFKTYVSGTKSEAKGLLAIILSIVIAFFTLMLVYLYRKRKKKNL